MRNAIRRTAAAAVFLSLFSASLSWAGMTLLEETAPPGLGPNPELREDRGLRPETEEKREVTGVGQGGSGVTVSSQAGGAPESETRADRRWIIKESGTTSPPVKAPELGETWDNEAQESRCTALVDTLRSSFANARYHSIRGDACRTAQYASKFLETAEACRMDCPQGYLERSGYTERITRNVGILLQLGEKRCMDWEVRGEEKAAERVRSGALPEDESAESERERRNVQ